MFGFFMGLGVDFGYMGLRGCGSAIVEGGFESLASPETDWRCWSRYGFVDERESFALVDQVHAELEVGRGKVK